jgi:hypothetical protein
VKGSGLDLAFPFLDFNKIDESRSALNFSFMIVHF